MQKSWLRFAFIPLSGLGSVLAAKVSESVPLETTFETDLFRLSLALVVGSVVQGLTLMASGRGFDRIDRANTKAKRTKARLMNLGEILLTGFGAAGFVALMRGIPALNAPLPLEFLVATVVGSMGAERAFKLLEKRTPIFQNDDEKAGDGQ